MSEMLDTTFDEYVFNNFNDEIFTAIWRFIHEQPEKLRLKRRLRRTDSKRLSGWSVQPAQMEDTPGDDLYFKIHVMAQLAISDTGQKWEKVVFQPFELFCHMDLSDEMDELEILDVSVAARLHLWMERLFDRKEIYLSNKLVPSVTEEDLEKMATHFLREFYPEALQKPMALDPYVLAERMGLTIMEQRIDREMRVYGQIYFQKAVAEFYDDEEDKTTRRIVPRGTIVVDGMANFHRDMESDHSTIVHECVHWRYHRKRFMFEQKVRGKDATAMRCCEDGTVLNACDRLTREMELQANMVAPRIQMPRKMFEKMAKEVIGWQIRRSGDTLCDAMPEVIGMLAKIFDVSKMAAKQRLVDVGYAEAQGALVEVNGRTVPPHKWRKGSLAENETFTIPAEAVMLLLRSDARMREAARRCVYIDGHYVLNLSRYVVWHGDGEARMTDYARWHMDECCLRFTFVVQGGMDARYAREYFLNRGALPEYRLNYDFSAPLPELREEKEQPVNEAKIEELDRIYQAKRETKELLQELEEIHHEEKAKIDREFEKALEQKLELELAKLPENTRTEGAIMALTNKLRVTVAQDFKRKLKYPPSKEWNRLIHLRGMNREDLADVAHLSVYQLQRITGLYDEHPKLEKVVLMCLALRLPPDISRYMIKRSHIDYHPENINSEHFLFDTALEMRYTASLGETRIFLLSKGIEL